MTQPRKSNTLADLTVIEITEPVSSPSDVLHPASVQISHYAGGASWSLSGLTPDEARELAADLIAAADGVER